MIDLISLITADKGNHKPFYKTKELVANFMDNYIIQVVEITTIAFSQGGLINEPHRNVIDYRETENSNDQF